MRPVSNKKDFSRYVQYKRKIKGMVVLLFSKDVEIFIDRNSYSPKLGTTVFHIWGGGKQTALKGLCMFSDHAMLNIMD